MSKDAFSRAVETDLRTRRAPFDPRELRHFLSQVWPLVRPGDVPGVWASAFAQATAHRAHASPPAYRP